MVRPLVLAILILIGLVPGPASAAPPRLVVILVVDQMRNDYIDDYGAHWTGGLHRLVSQGARFKNAAYPYLNTVTCAGHASIGTGTVPAVHGIVLNQWWDRALGAPVSCTDDRSTPDVSLDGRPVTGGHGPGRLLVPTLAETLRQASGGRSRVVTMSLKPRSAIMLAGHQADAVIWLDAPSWASSSAFVSGPVPFVGRHVKRHPIEADLGREWTRRLPAEAYKYEDDGLAESPIPGWTRTFPHAIGTPGGSADERFYDQWETSPYADAYLGEMAAAALDDMKLGRGPGIDFLGVSFSTLDLVGHNFGPRSHEVQDVLAGLDVTIGKLLRVLDKKVGRGRYVVAFSADHGVACLPEQLGREGIDAGRVVMDGITREVNAAVAEAFGPGTYVARLEYTNLYFQPGVFDRIRTRPDVLERVKAAIMSRPGVAGVLVAADLDYRAPPADPIARAAAMSQYAPRAGDLIVLPARNWFFTSAKGGAGTTHGTAHSYDTQVPVVFMGAGIKPGTYDDASAPIDIAPTLARIAGASLPAATGRVLESALADTAGARAAATHP